MNHTSSGGPVSGAYGVSTWHHTSPREGGHHTCFLAARDSRAADVIHGDGQLLQEIH